MLLSLGSLTPACHQPRISQLIHSHFYSRRTPLYSPTIDLHMYQIATQLSTLPTPRGLMRATCITIQRHQYGIGYFSSGFPSSLEPVLSAILHSSSVFLRLVETRSRRQREGVLPGKFIILACVCVFKIERSAGPQKAKGRQI